MRNDMAKLLCEKERRGSNRRNAKTGLRVRPCEVWYDPVDYDADIYPDLPARAKSSRRGPPYGYEGKELSDFLSPLRGYLRSRVGDKWADIWSEICRNLDRRSTSGLHVFQHLKYEVTTGCVLGPDGEVHGKDWRPGYKAGEYIGGLYVHPGTGTLEYKTPYYELPEVRDRWRRRVIPSIVWIVPEVKAYAKIGDLWYVVRYSKLDWVKAPDEAFKSAFPRGVHFPRAPRTIVDENYAARDGSRWLIGNGSLRSYHWLQAASAKKSLNGKELRDLRARLQAEKEKS